MQETKELPRVNWDEYRCRCSGISKIMSNPINNQPLTVNQRARMAELESKPVLTDKQIAELSALRLKNQRSYECVLSATCIEHLMEAYSVETTGKVNVRKEIDIDQIEKGKMAEGSSISLLSVIDGVFYIKNERRVINDYLSGEPDLYVGESIYSAKMITDIKTCYDYPSFLKKINTPIENGWEEQVQGYMDITGAPEGEIAYCLVDTPEIMINDIKRRLFFRGNYVTEESPEFLEKWERLEKSMRFDDIPIRQRVYRVKISPFTPERRQQIYDRVKICREWLWRFDEMYRSLNT
jgi:hypothetical protein